MANFITSKEELQRLYQSGAIGKQSFELIFDTLEHGFKLHCTAKGVLSFSLLQEEEYKMALACFDEGSMDEKNLLQDIVDLAKETKGE